MKNGRLDSGDIPLAEKADLFGGTPEEGGAATKDAPQGTGRDMGSGNRLRDSSGATLGASGEGLDEDTRNLGSEEERGEDR